MSTVLMPQDRQFLVPHEPFRDWVSRNWPKDRAAVLSDYAALKDLEFFLADLALMSGVNAAPGYYTDPIVLAQAEGARQLGAMILSRAEVDPMALMSRIKHAHRKADE